MKQENYQEYTEGDKSCVLANIGEPTRPPKSLARGPQPRLTGILN